MNNITLELSPSEYIQIKSILDKLKNEEDNLEPLEQSDILTVNEDPNNDISPEDLLINDEVSLSSEKEKEDEVSLSSEKEDKKDSLEKIEIIKIDLKINLNIGGKKFKLNKDTLELLNIQYNKLFLINKNNKYTYFLDRDPYYFSKIIEIIKECKGDLDNIKNNIDNYSENLIGELYFYKLIDKKPIPKIKLKRVSFPIIEENIIKIIIDDQLFETSSNTLSRSNFFANKLKNDTKQFYLENIDSKIFRYILNFLRIGELYLINKDIMKMLYNFEIEYQKIDDIKIEDDIVSNYISSNKLSIDNFNTIISNSSLKFNSEIIFDIIGENNLSDLMLYIDLPIIKPTEKFKYIDNIKSNIIEYIEVIDNNNTFRINNELIFLYPIIYKNYEINKENKKVKLLYENTLIDIYRIYLPIYYFENFYIKSKIKLIVKIVSLDKILDKYIKDIPLLNVSLIVNSIKNNYNNNIKPHYKNFLNKNVDINLDNYGMIKDIIIITKEDNILFNNLIEIELISKDKIYSRMDSYILNEYIPLKKLNHILPEGIYYLSFNKLGLNNILRIKTKKIGLINIFINEILT